MSDDMSISAVRIRIAACAFPAREEMYFSRDGVFHRNVLIPPQPPTIDDALALLAAFDELRAERDRLTQEAAHLRAELASISVALNAIGAHIARGTP